MDRYPLNVDAFAAWCGRHGGRPAHGDAAPDVLILLEILGQKLPVRVAAHKRHPVITVAIVAPFTVAEDRRTEMSLAVTAANASILMGTWVLQPTGELFYRVALPTMGVEVDDNTLADILKLVVGTVQAAAPSFHAIANDGASHTILVEQALARAKKARGEG